MGQVVTPAARRAVLGGVGRALQAQLSWWLQFCRRKPLGAISLVIILITILAAVFAPVVVTHDHLAQNYRLAMKGPSAQHWLGTDDFGRDFYSRIVYGARVSLMVAFFSIAVGTGAGLILGIISGYMGGWVDNVMQRITEIFLAFPTIVLAMALMAVFQPGLDKVIIALSIIFAPRTLRVVRGTVLQVKALTYVDAARAVGATGPRIMSRHILPNILAPYLIVATALLGAAITTEASLSFLGLGVPPPHASWGRMLSGGAQAYALTAPHLVVFPGLAITLVVMAFNLFGDALRDVWDPKLRGR